MSKSPRPEDFFSESPPARIIGTESECNIQSREGLSEYSYISAEAIAASGHNAVGEFFDNGARIYVDLQHLEVDTPESLGPRQAAAADMAAVRLLADVVEASGLPHGGLYRQSGTVIKNIQQTSGYHENFLIPRSITRQDSFRPIIASHLTSRVWATAGIVARNFQLSQKVSGIGDPPITSSYLRRTHQGRKPMAMVPSFENDQGTLGPNPEWARLEVRFADPSFSSTSRYLGLAATSLVLRLIEHHDLIDTEELINLSFLEYAASARKFSNDLSFSTVAETISGINISAIDYQELLIEACLELSEKIELPQDELDAIDPWLDVCDRLRDCDLNAGEYAGLLTLLDFAPRHRYLTRHFESKDLHSYNPNAVEANLIWDRILPIGGGLIYWQKTPSSYISEDEVDELLWSPPDTRAAIRGNLIRKYPNRIKNVKWASIDVEGKTGNVSLDDPYATSIKD